MNRRNYNGDRNKCTHDQIIINCTAIEETCNLIGLIVIFKLRDFIL